MLMVNQLIGFGAGGENLVTITRTANPTPSGSGTSRTYSSQSIGDASADRIVCLIVACKGSGTINSATIDYGTGASAMSATTQGTGDGSMLCKLFYLAAPTGTTATFVITFSGFVSTGQDWIAVYSVTGANATPAASGSDGSADMDATDPLTTGSVTIPARGGFLAGAISDDETTNITWANATEDLDEQATSERRTTATRTTAGTVTITCQSATNLDKGALAYIIFNPAS